MEEKKYYYRLASPEYISQSGMKFDEELDRQISGTLAPHHVYQLGYPGELLQAAGFPDDKIEFFDSFCKLLDPNEAGGAFERGVELDRRCA